MNIKYTIRLDNGVQTEAAGPDTIQLNTGDFCVFQKEFNTEYGEVIRIHGEISGEEAKTLPALIRQATVRDQGAANENLSRNRAAVRTAAKYVEQLNLEMNLLNAHYTFDGKGVMIQFTAEGRVDFRELVKELSKALA
jgi:cell fate regulator YaaT (PSP1 superfamily)